ncbi:unnamed protein product [Albugo candida]|uniref:Uncharacterized protein n=1 Tax=Albugo candida TaxID=65357 RepID=A0A024FZ11_9STRA|nr:unnamed protein product [Albugo candida]|eukprot:CCI39814.1 unnamed protein product [Albugo candida]
MTATCFHCPRIFIRNTHGILIIFALQRHFRIAQSPGSMMLGTFTHLTKHSPQRICVRYNHRILCVIRLTIVPNELHIRFEHFPGLRKKVRKRLWISICRPDRNAAARECVRSRDPLDAEYDRDNQHSHPFPGPQAVQIIP